LPALAAIGALEQRSRLRADPHDVRLLRMAGLDVPGAAERPVVPVRERRVLARLPGLAEVTRDLDPRTAPGHVDAGEQRFAGPWIEGHVIDGLPWEVRSLQGPPLSRRAAAEHVHTLLRAEQHQDTARHR